MRSDLKNNVYLASLHWPAQWVESSPQVRQIAAQIAPWHSPFPRILERGNPMGGIVCKKPRHMPSEAQLALTNFAVDLTQSCLPELKDVGDVVLPQISTHLSK